MCWDTVEQLPSIHDFPRTRDSLKNQNWTHRDTSGITQGIMNLKFTKLYLMHAQLFWVCEGCSILFNLKSSDVLPWIESNIHELLVTVVQWQFSMFSQDLDLAVHSVTSRISCYKSLQGAGGKVKIKPHCFMEFCFQQNTQIKCVLKPCVLTAMKRSCWGK